jgi:excisionase family DNA binding protein
MNTKSDRTVTKRTGPTHRAWSILEVAESLSVSRGFVYREVRRGCLTARRLGRRIVILDEDYANYLANALSVVEPAGSTPEL